DGASEENSEEQDDNDEEELLDFAQLNVDSILCHGRLLLGSAGKEYEIEEDDSVDAGERLAKHRRQLKQQLGLGGQFLDDEMLVNEADLITIPTRGSGMAAGRRLKRKEADAEDIKLLAIGDDGVAQAESDPPGIDMSKLSARERNRLKRKAKRSVKSVKAKIDLNQPSKQPAAEKTTPMEVEVTEQPGDSGKIMVEAKHPEDKAALFAISSGRWPFDRFVKVLCMDLFDPQWQVRQGAGMALREIFKAQGRGAGRSAGLDREGNRRGAQQYLVDICIRLLCVFALDRFGDFVSDQVVAPVRETCAQALGAVVRYLDTPGVEGVRSVLMQLIQRGSQPGLEVWEMRHAGFLGLKYLAAVTRNVDGPVIDAVLGGLGDADDDIRGVSAETLLPLVDGLIEDLEARIMDVVEALWKALSDIGDDLAASTSSIMDLLAALFQHDKVRQKVLVTSRNRPEFGFSVLLPKLFPFFRHTLTGVRRAAVETTRTLVEIQHESAACSGNGSSDDQVNTACIRMTFQNMLVETNDHVLGQSLELWRLLISTICEVEGEQCLPRILPRELVASMFCLTFTPIGVPLDTKLMFRPSLSLSPPLPSLGSSPVTTSCVRHNVDEPMLRQELSLVPPSLIMRCRIALSQALGELMSLWQRASLAEVFGGILAGYIESSVSLHRQLSGTVIEEWVVAEKRRLCGRPLVGDRSGGPVAPLPLDIESISVDVVAKGPLAATLADRLLRVVASTVGGGQRVYYSDLVSLLRQVHADAQRLVQAFTDELKMPPASTVTIPPHCMGDAAQSAQASGDVFTPELADHIKDAVYPSVVGSLPSRSSKTILNSLEEKFRRLSSSLAHYQLQDQRLSMEVNASLAGAIVALGRLPQKLAPVIKSLTSAIKDQNDPLLQRRSARSVAQLTLHCLTGPNRRAGPADKLVKNLSVFLCSNQWDTPDFAKLSAQGSNEGILMLELNQHRQERDEMKAFIAKTASTGSVSGGEATGTKAFSTA
ncbi:TATA-binding protein-associated factor mot1, partial [Spiromyces aspiralis]